MQIQFERSGGFAGIKQQYCVALDSLPEEERRKVMGLIADAGFFDLPSTLPKGTPGADQFQYKISVDSDQGTHEVQVDQSAVPAGLQPLIAWLQAAARKH